MEFQSIKAPKIERSDLPELTNLLAVFDVVTFNMFAEFVAQMEIELPVVGIIVISYFCRESHLKVWRKDDPKETALCNLYFYVCPLPTRDELISQIKAKIMEKAIVELG